MHFFNLISLEISYNKFLTTSGACMSSPRVPPKDSELKKEDSPSADKDFASVSEDSPSPKLNEIPVWRPRNETMEITLEAIKKDLVLQLRKLNSSRRSSLTPQSSNTTPDEALSEFGSWRYIWGNKNTGGAKTDKGLLNIGKIIGEEFLINEASKNRRTVKPNISYKYDWDNVKGKHFNTVELFQSVQTPESSPKFITTFEKAYLYNDKLKYLYDPKDKRKLPNAEEKNEIKEYILQSRPEVNINILDLTEQGLKSNAIMTSYLAQQLFKNFFLDDKYLINYFRDFKGLLRPVIDCARVSYLNNSGENILNNDEYDTFKIHQRVTNYISHLWKKEITEILKLIVAIKKLNSEPSREEYKQNLESKEKALKELCDNFSLSDAKEILFNEIHHALYGNTGRNAVLHDLIKVFDKIPESSITEELFNRVGIDSEYEEFAKIVLNLPYRQEYLMTHESDLEPKFKKQISAQAVSSSDVANDDSSDNKQRDEIEIEDGEKKSEEDDQEARSGFRHS
jgi:hypothetical protein